MKNTIDPSLNKITSKLVNVPSKAHRHWVQITPKDTGNAKRSTSLQGNVIKAKYNYATQLDNGHSKQAPRGMVKPTKEFLDRLIKNILRK